MGGWTRWGAELLSHDLPGQPDCQKRARLPAHCPTPATVCLPRPCEAPGACGPRSGDWLMLLAHRHLPGAGQEALQAAGSLQQLKCSQAGRGWLKSNQAVLKIK